MGATRLISERPLDRLERWAPWIALSAGLWFALATLWEAFGPLPGGHLGNATGAAIAGENMLHWRLFGAVLEYTPKPPVPAQLYCHHPYGVFLVEALSHALLGHGWVAVRTPAIVMSALSPWLLYRFSRSLWSATAAAMATVAFTLIPIDLAFSSFSSLEVMVIFFGLLFSWATARLWQSWRGMYLLTAIVGAFGACHSDWVGLVLVGTVGVFAFVRVYVLTPSGRVDQARHARWFAWSTAAAVTTLVLYLALFAKAGKLGDLLSSAENRSTGASAGFRSIFGQRRVMWVLFMLPVPALVSIVVGPVLSAIRAAGGLAEQRRRPVELIVVAWMLAASVQYFLFRQGADVHIFWPHYYGVVAALGFGVITEVILPPSAAATTAPDRVLGADARSLDSEISLEGALPLPQMAAAAGGDVPSRGPGGEVSLSRTLLSLAPISVVVIAIALVGRVGVVQLAQSRLTGGRFDDGGRYIAVDQDRAQFVQWAVRDLAPDRPLGLHRSFVHAWNVEYAAHRPIVQQQALGDPAPERDGPRYVLVDTRYATAPELRSIASHLAVTAVGPFWKVDRTRSAPLVALRYDEHQPTLVERFAITGTDLVRRIGEDEDPWQTLAWHELLGGITDPPPAPPRTAEDAVIAFDLARARGDETTASSLRALAESIVKRPSSGQLAVHEPIPFDNDLRLLGVHVDDGAATVVTLLWETGPAFAPFEGEFLVRSQIRSAPLLWTSATDFYEKETAPPMWPKVSLWKPDHLYVQRFVDMRRVGTERFEGLWSVRGTAPRAAGGKERIELFTLR